ncbi:MAG: MFS transporter, partial [Nitrososphaeria archaeon]|nr:MFS transporter [Nitrososphaeria archaeon]
MSSNSTLWVGVIRVLHGLGLSLFIISGLSLATLISTKEKIRSIGIFTLTASLGMMIGPGVASLGVRFLGFRGAFLLSMIASSMACVFSLVILRRFRGDPGLEESRASLKTIL